MPRPATGQVIVDKRRRSPTFGLRFRAYGRREYIALGTAKEGWTRAKAQTELQNVLADVRRGIWHSLSWRSCRPHGGFPPSTYSPRSGSSARRSRVAVAVVASATPGRPIWSGACQVTCCLSRPVCASWRLDQITVENVDRYRLGKVREGKLGVTSINKTLTTLAAILEAAVEYELIDRNPAKLAEDGFEPLPEGLTPHSLRHTEHGLPTS
jgi:hypothetical protein